MMSEDSLDDVARCALLDQIALIAEQAAKPPEQQKAVITPVIEEISNSYGDGALFLFRNPPSTH